MRDVLTFNGRSLADFNTFFDGSKSFGSPEPDYDIISIPGRNGDLSIYNNRYKDMNISIPCFIRDNFLENYRNLMAFLNSAHGYLRLESSKEPEYFRKALFLGSVEPTTYAFNASGKFTLNFRCHPQRYLKIGEEPIIYTPLPGDTVWTLRNPTHQTAKPNFRVYGIGQVYVNNKTFTTSDLSAGYYLDVDSEICEVTMGPYNMNSHFAGTFPLLEPGDNEIKCQTTLVSRIEVTPRWFEI